MHVEDWQFFQNIIYSLVRLKLKILIKFSYVYLEDFKAEIKKSLKFKFYHVYFIFE